MITIPPDRRELAGRQDDPLAGYYGGGSGRFNPTTVVFPDPIRRRHTVVYGSTGVGKTTFLETLILSDIARRLSGQSSRGFAVIDVVGDLSRNILARLALVREQLGREARRQLDQMVYLIDPTNPEWSAAYDPLEVKRGETPESRADHLSAGISVLYHEDPEQTVRRKRVFKHAVLALIVARRSLPDLPRFLRDKGFRDAIVSASRHPGLIGFWFDEFPNQERAFRERVESTFNRLDILFDRDIEEMLTGPSTFDFRKAMDDGAFVLCHCPRYRLGEGAAYLLAAFFLLEFQQAALSRLELADSARRPFTIIADEWQHFATDSILQIVEGSRKVALELVLATQEVVGPPKQEALRQTIRKVVGNIISFRVSHQDAKVLAPELLTPELEQVKHTSIRYQKVPGIFGEYTQRFEDPLFRGQDEIWEREIRKITQLPDRCFWWKMQGDPHSYLVETPSLKSIEELADTKSLKALLAQQEAAAFRLAGRRKFKRLPWPSSQGFEVEGLGPKKYDPFGW